MCPNMLCKRAWAGCCMKRSGLRYWRCIEASANLELGLLGLLGWTQVGQDTRTTTRPTGGPYRWFLANLQVMGHVTQARVGAARNGCFCSPARSSFSIATENRSPFQVLRFGPLPVLGEVLSPPGIENAPVQPAAAMCKAGHADTHAQLSIRLSVRALSRWLQRTCTELSCTSED